MPLKVIGAGVGRTGTNSLKLAINRLGLGPCHHMLEVRQNMALHVPLWNAAADGRPDWQAIYKGYWSVVDWPTADRRVLPRAQCSLPVGQIHPQHTQPRELGREFLGDDLQGARR